MRIMKGKSKDPTYHVIQDVRRNGKRSTEIIENLGHFISLMIYRILEKQLDERFTCEHIISTLRKITVRNVGEYGYIPNYTRTGLTDALHENAGFRTDTELTTPKAMTGIIRCSKEK